MVRQNEAQRPHDMGRDAPQGLAFGQRLAHQAEFAILKVAQAAMNELGGGRGGAAREVALLA